MPPLQMYEGGRPRTPRTGVSARFADHRAANGATRALQRELLEHDERYSDAQIFDIGCEFHETIVGGSGNPFLLDGIRRVNSLRRLLEYLHVVAGLDHAGGRSKAADTRTGDEDLPCHRSIIYTFAFAPI